jgi:hypothetical protein
MGILAKREKCRFMIVLSPVALKTPNANQFVSHQASAIDADAVGQVQVTLPRRILRASVERGLVNAFFHAVHFFRLVDLYLINFNTQALGNTRSFFACH